MKEYTAITYEKEDGIATITKVNADTGYSMSRDVIVQMRRALLDAQDDDDIRVIVITSESGIHQGAYAVNQGMEQPTGGEPLHIREFIYYGHNVASLIERMEKPVIGVIKKQAVGGGLETLHPCDFIIAAEDAQLSQPEVESCTIAGWGGCQRVSRIVNWRKAKKMLMLGLLVSGKEAEEIGLVTEAVPFDQVDETVRWYIDRLKNVAPHSVALTKAAMLKVWEGSHEAGLSYERELTSLLLTEGIFKEMTDAMAHGEKPEIKPYRHLTNKEEWK